MERGPIMLTAADTVTLWLEAGVPARMVWRGQRWRVTDRPTELLREVDPLPPMITHAPVLRVGWRFQAADLNGLNRVFDVCRAGDAWVIEHIYE
ncbi:hypothetical protein [Leifsonia sp. Root4]|uniref:hypothetical protein n=1 Tax=Leifsonia sp. Root4 TaxID=1736525 RepID=UPI00257119AC|nr:hypothetical protein [Leifsonia sp. Root4]